MAPFNGPATDPDDQTVPGGREEGNRQPRSGEDSRQRRMPAAVEAVLLFGHPPDLVLSTYQCLQSARDTDSQHATSLTGSGDAAMTGNAQPEAAVSAAALLEAVEDIVRCQRLSDVSPSGSVEAGRGVAASSALGLAASRGGAAEGDMVNRGQDGGNRTEERMTPSSQLHRGPQQSSSHTTQDWAASSTHTQSSLNSQSSMSTQSHTNTHASITEQYPSRNHSFIINADGVVSSIDSFHTSASSEIPESASSLTSSENPESASSVTSSENPESVSSVTSPENPESTSSVASACAVSSAVESSVGSAALATSLPATNFVTASHRTDSEVESPAAETAAARATAATAPAFPNTAIDSNPRSRPPPASRDRSGDRKGEEQETVPEERARERRRQLSRLRALREENRRLKARQTCRQCRQNPVALTLLPCGHFCLCQDCGPSVEECPVCRKTILADVRTFVS